MKWPKRIIVDWGKYDYAEIVSGISPPKELCERRVYVLAPLKKRKRAKRRAGR